MLLEIVVLFLASLTALGLFLRAAEWRLVFYPSPHPDGYWEPEGYGETFFDEYFESDEGLKLHGWWAPVEDTRKTILWCHGNSGNITYRLPDFRLYMELGFQVFLFDYRGYGKSEGRPSEEGLYRDGRAAYEHLKEAKGLNDEDIFLLGRSLGGAVATKVATEVEAAGLLLQSPFTKIRDMARNALPLPVLPDLMRIQLDSERRIDQINKPLLFVHGNDDDIVPISLGRQLFEKALEPKWFIEIDGAGHDFLSKIGGETYRTAIVNFVHHLTPEPEEEREKEGAN